MTRIYPKKPGSIDHCSVANPFQSKSLANAKAKRLGRLDEDVLF